MHPGGDFPLVFRQAGLLFILVACVQGLIWRKRVQSRIVVDPKLDNGFHTLVRIWLVYGNLPWLLLGGAVLCAERFPHPCMRWTRALGLRRPDIDHQCPDMGCDLRSSLLSRRSRSHAGLSRLVRCSLQAPLAGKAMVSYVPLRRNHRDHSADLSQIASYLMPRPHIDAVAWGLASWR